MVLRDPQVDGDLAGAASVVARESCFAGRRVGIEQAVRRLDQPGLVGIGRDAGTGVE